MKAGGYGLAAKIARCSLAVFIAVYLLAGCTAQPTHRQSDEPQKKLRVAFSQPEINNPWRVYESLSVKQAAEEYGAELIYRDAKSDVETQKKDLYDFINMGVDYILLAPRVEEGFCDVFEKAREANIPIILIDRSAKGEPGRDFVTVISADFAEEGRKAARVLAHQFEGRRCNIVEITGTPGATSTIGRDIGFKEVVEMNPNMHIVAAESGEYVRTQAQQAMEAIIQSGKYEIDAVFAHDDDSGIGAIQALKEAGFVPGKDVMVVSIAGQKDAFKAIIAGELLASIECNPRLGRFAFDVIDKLEKGQTVSEKIVYTGKVYDASNAQQLFDEAF